MDEQGDNGKTEMEKVYGMWKRRLTTWEKYVNIVRECKDVMTKPKFHLE